jgi:hypothetical protein
MLSANEKPASQGGPHHAVPFDEGPLSRRAGGRQWRRCWYAASDQEGQLVKSGPPAIETPRTDSNQDRLTIELHRFVVRPSPQVSDQQTWRLAGVRPRAARKLDLAHPRESSPLPAVPHQAPSKAAAAPGATDASVFGCLLILQRIKSGRGQCEFNGCSDWSGNDLVKWMAAKLGVSPQCCIGERCDEFGHDLQPAYNAQPQVSSTENKPRRRCAFEHALQLRGYKHEQRIFLTRHENEQKALRV